ncbi:MAG: RNA polymerase sigma factor [Gammaproteobacteria bacterium]|nr:RNA polymerase sigma factor [Gammaproteobacteria bacterium]
MTATSDKELIKEFSAGNQVAFDAFVRRHQDRIYRLACARLYSADDAADAAQEVFLRAYKGLKRFHFHAEPFTWLYRTLENVCNEYNRRTVRDRTLNQRLEDVDALHACANDGPEQIHIRQIHHVIAQLPQRQQDVVLLRIFEGMSVEETARTLKCREGTVKAHLHKAINNLRSYFNAMNIETTDYE